MNKTIVSPFTKVICPECNSLHEFYICREQQWCTYSCSKTNKEIQIMSMVKQVVKVRKKK